MFTDTKEPRRRAKHAWWFHPLKVRVERLHPHKKVWRRGRWLARLKESVEREMIRRLKAG
jgi:hypothetical protein